jgi:hypothetical protein
MMMKMFDVRGEGMKTLFCEFKTLFDSIFMANLLISNEILKLFSAPLALLMISIVFELFLEAEFACRVFLNLFICLRRSFSSDVIPWTS